MDASGLREAVERHLTPLVRIRGREQGHEGIVDRLRRRQVPGAQFAVVAESKLLWSGAYGELEAGSGRAIDNQSLFQAASISKPVTALAALRLVGQGRLDLDSPVNDWLRSWRIPENEHTTKRSVSLRDLLSHTAGTTVHGFPGYPSSAPLPNLKQVLDGEPPANTGAVRVDSPVAQQFRYSGGGTTIVQQLLIDITGMAFPELMRELVLEPIGMLASTYEQPLPADRRAAAATAHEQDGTPVPGHWHTYPEMAAAGLWTTARDVANFILGLQAAVDGASGALLPTELARAMVSSQNGTRVGLGPMLAGSADPRFVHAGVNHGFTAQFMGFVRHGDGVVALTNGAERGGSALINEVFGALGAAQGWSGFASRDVTAVDLPPAHLERLVGTYAMTGSSFTVRRTGSQLTLTAPLVSESEMVATSDRTFVLTDGSLDISFDAGDAGRAPMMTLSRWDESWVANRVS